MTQLFDVIIDSGVDSLPQNRWEVSERLRDIANALHEDSKNFIAMADSLEGGESRPMRWEGAYLDVQVRPSSEDA
jgi:hypothetical protein